MPSKIFTAGVVKLVDTLDLGSSALRLGGSSPFTRTKKPSETQKAFFMQSVEDPFRVFQFAIDPSLAIEFETI